MLQAELRRGASIARGWGVTSSVSDTGLALTCLCVTMQVANASKQMRTLDFGMQSDSCGVRTHALADWRLKPAP